MRLDDLTPPPDNKKVIEFCESICAGERPFYVPVKPERYAIQLRCFENVRKKIQHSGGGIVFGWEIGWEPHIYLEAQFHSVWQSPSGTYADVTPPSLPHPHIHKVHRILFLRDTHRTDGPSIVPPRRAALADPVLVEKLWQLSDEIMETEEQMERSGFPLSEIASTTRAARTEARSIREKLSGSA